MEIVINNCFGGFSLSPLGIKEYANIKGKEAYFFDGGLRQEYNPISLEYATKKGIFIIAFSVPNPNDYLKKKNWNEMSDKEQKQHNKTYEEISLQYGRSLKRDDPDLLKVIKKLGKKANGRCAQLKIVEIPDGTNYTIEEYDGLEHIAETHRTWR